MGMMVGIISLVIGVVLIAASFVVGIVLMRREYPGPWPLATLALILINVVVFAAFALTGMVEQAISSYGLRPASVLQGGNLPSLLTAFFMHADFWHLSGNMLALFIMGYVLERQVGSTRFLVFFMFAGLAVSAADLAMRSTSAVPAVGASGAISGVFGACLIGAPRAKAPLFFLLSMLFPIVLLIGLATPEAPIFILPLVFGVSILIIMFMILALFAPNYRITWYALPFLLAWIVAQTMLALAGLGSEVHYGAHVAGFLAGLGGWFLMRKRETKEIGMHLKGKPHQSPNTLG